ncbi:glycoside hydrolase family 26 protein [Seonamhaeicola marinus]|nr:glycosyl hydrolase [Seonamhaeicola marinus]
MKELILKFLTVTLLLTSCTTDELDLFDPDATRVPQTLIPDVTFADPNIVQEAKDLHLRLQLITQKGIAFGQQGAIGGGVNFFDFESLESDFSRVAGDWPAIIGFDLEELELWDPLIPNPNVQDFRQTLLTKAHNNGSIITLSWHASNPLTRRNSFDRTKAVTQMLEGGFLRDTFLLYLERIAYFLNNLKDENGNPIPVLFRPWHEMNGDFFFWGEGLRSTEEFKQLFRDTVTILTETYNVHNVLYVYAPNTVKNASEYLKNYPGDAYVDILGIDVYDHKSNNFVNDAIRNLEIVETIAKEKNMLFAFTETGLENVTESNWWTEQLYKAIRSSSISYTMVWRNATPNHFYAPYLGHPAEDDFRTFVSKDLILLHKDIQQE